MVPEDGWLDPDETVTSEERFTIESQEEKIALHVEFAQHRAIRSPFVRGIGRRDLDCRRTIDNGIADARVVLTARWPRNAAKEIRMIVVFTRLPTVKDHIEAARL